MLCLLHAKLDTVSGERTLSILSHSRGRNGIQAPTAIALLCVCFLVKAEMRASVVVYSGRSIPTPLRLFLPSHSITALSTSFLQSLSSHHQERQGLQALHYRRQGISRLRQWHCHLCIGTCPSRLIKAVNDQMNQVHHVSNLYFIPAQAKLAQWLCDNSVADKVFFCNSGAEANEAAIKVARKHAYNRGITEPVIITAHQSFHGRTLAALTATAQPKYHKGFGYGGKMVPGFEYVPYNDAEALRNMVESLITLRRAMVASVEWRPS